MPVNPPKWVKSAWMMSTSPPSMNGAASHTAWIRSPVAIDVAVARRTRLSAAACSGGTGSSIQRVAHGGHDGAPSTPVGRAEPDARRTERVELHRPVAAGDHRHRQLGDPGGL